MTSTGRDALRQQLMDHEGERLRVYRDSVGILTIGVGRNLETIGISEAESRILLDNDITRCLDEAAHFPWFAGLDEVRQRAVLDLLFNLGFSRLLGFRRTLDYLAAGKYDSAAYALEQSRWYQQVGRRAKRIVAMVRTGVDGGLR